MSQTSSSARQLQFQTFHQQKGHFQVSLTIQGKQRQRKLKIDLVNKKSFQKFEKVINQIYIDYQESMHNIIESPQQLYTLLTESFNDLRFSQNGQINFVYNYGNKKKLITIQTDKKINEQNLNILSSKPIKQILCLFIIFVIVQYLILSITSVLFNFPVNVSRQLKQINNKLELFQAQQRQFHQGNNYNVISNQHYGNTKLSINKQGRKYKVKHITPNQSINFIDDFWISFPMGQTTKITIKIIKTIDKNLGIGVGTKNMIGKNHHSDKNLLSVKFDHNSVYEYGYPSYLDPLNLVDGNVIEMMVDRRFNIVTWMVDSIKIAESPIAQRFQGQTLYLIISTYSQSDEFEVYW